MFSKETYTGRRAELALKMQGREQNRKQADGQQDRGLILLPGNDDAPINYPHNPYRFRQDSTFLYYFGLSRPSLAGVIDTDSGAATLFGNEATMDDIIWMGPQPKIADLAAEVGVTTTAPLQKLSDTIARALAQGRQIHILPPYRAETRLLLAGLFAGTEPRPSDELIRAVVAMRDKKSAEEVAEIEKACATSYEMHTLAMQMCRPGVVERDIAGAIEAVAIRKGWGVSFPPIVSEHGETLHNVRQDGILTPGRLMLVDAGAEALSGYASDHTRTMPVGGRFSTKQKEIYDIVLAANNRAFAISKPGVRYVDVHLAASRVLLEGLHSLGLVKGNVDEALAAGAHALFMPHGVGHQMGLDVHDMESFGENYVGYDSETPRSTDPATRACRMARKLEPGMVVTVEPGIYFIPDLVAKWRSEGTCAPFIDFTRVAGYLDFGGIRLEDDMLVTPTGNRLLGARDGNGTPKRIPITTSEVESAMA